MWIVRIVVQNGCAVYATWTSVASNLNFSQFLYTYSSLKPTDACLVALCLILAATLNYFIIENFVCRHHLKWMWTPYPTLIWALSASLSKNIIPNTSLSRNNIFLIVILGIVVMLMAIRVALFFLFKTEKYSNRFLIRFK